MNAYTKSRTERSRVTAEAPSARARQVLWLRNLCRGGAPQRPAKAGLVHPPEVVLHTVDQGHRDLFPVGSAQLGIVKDRELHPVDAQIQRHPFDQVARRAAQMAAGLGDEDDPRSSGVQKKTDLR